MLFLVSVKLTPRLDALAQQLETSDLLIDVGADHAYLAIHAVQKQIVKRALALDINQDPLIMAAKNVASFGLEGEIECRLSDGLAEVQEEEIDTVVIAGMGGHTIKAIIQASLSKAQAARFLLLQPNNGEEKLRRFLYSQGFIVKSQGVVNEKKHFYQWIKVVYEGKPREIDGFYGAYGDPLKHQDPDQTVAWLQWESQRIEKILSGLKKSKTKNAKEKKLRESLFKLNKLANELTIHQD